MLLVIVGVFYPAYLLQQLRPRAIDSQTTTAVLQIQTDQLRSDLNRLKASKSPTPEQLAEIARRATAERVKLARAQGENEKIGFFVSQAKVITILAYVVSICGFFLGSSGFSLWYVKVQKPADELAARRIKEMEP